VKRFVAVIGLVAVTGLTTLVSAGPAAADPSLCLHVDISIQDQGQTQDLCLPPA
jgi:hypothetical protein